VPWWAPIFVNGSR